MVFTEEAEPGRRTLLGQTMSGALTVEPPPQLGPPERWWTQRAQASEATVLRGGYRVTNDRNDRPVALRQWLEPEPIELNYTFKAFPLRSGGESLPEPFAPLYVIPYPSPFQGEFLSTDRAEAERLSQSWWQRPPDPPRAAVIRPVAGVCPPGSELVYRVFLRDHLGQSHRWIRSLERYLSLLRRASFDGEGVVFCSPE